ncbi:MAG: hypothetical protein FVQ76_13990, partial [Nitrospira sp.]|nr:hypothetical protein [Nitrospira sp.]
MRKLFCFLCAVLLCGAASTLASAQELTVDELEMLMPGTTIETTNRNDWDFYITFNEHGTLNARIDANREFLDDGKWWAQDSADSSKTLAMFCFQFDEFGEGKKYCNVFTLQINGRTIERYKGDGTRLPKDWIITKPGPLASAVIEARKATRIAKARGTAPPAEQPLSRQSPTAPAPPVQQPRLTAAQDTRPPVIDVPATIAAKGAVAAISGRIRDTSRIVEVTIDGLPIAVETDGTFSVRRGVPQGRSTITIAALDEWGNRAEQNVTLTRDTLATRSPAPVKPKTAPMPRPDPFAGIHFGAYHALVIGNNNYRG